MVNSSLTVASPVFLLQYCNTLCNKTLSWMKTSLNLTDVEKIIFGLVVESPDDVGKL
jgi:hypothetical protein